MIFWKKLNHSLCFGVYSLFSLFSDFITFDVGHQTGSMNDNPILVSPCTSVDVREWIFDWANQVGTFPHRCLTELKEQMNKYISTADARADSRGPNHYQL